MLPFGTNWLANLSDVHHDICVGPMKLLPDDVTALILSMLPPRERAILLTISNYQIFLSDPPVEQIFPFPPIAMAASMPVISLHVMVAESLPDLLAYPALNRYAAFKQQDKAM